MKRALLWGGLAAALLLLLYAWPSTTLLHNSERMAPGTVRYIRGYWVARLPTGEFRVYENLEPHSSKPIYWAEGRWTWINWAFLWNGRPFWSQVDWPIERFYSPIYGEIYSLEGECLAGPCHPQGLLVVPTAVEGKRLKLLPGEAEHVDQG